MGIQCVERCIVCRHQLKGIEHIGHICDRCLDTKTSEEIQAARGRIAKKRVKRDEPAR